MQPYVDWFNVMTYDIHGTNLQQTSQLPQILTKHLGVWDSSNRFTGPYVRLVVPCRLI